MHPVIFDGLELTSLHAESNIENEIGLFQIYLMTSHSLESQHRGNVSTKKE